VPVISVGNITVGGTGKTPMVIEVVRRLRAMGRRPAVVSRGYGALDGLGNDEELLIRRHCPEVPCLSDSDRAAACRSACGAFGADVIVLDDGFQHRAVGRTLDLVLIDATCPFGYGRLLPRGLLREEPESLRRADAIVVTRYDQVDEPARSAWESGLDAMVPERPRLRCVYRVTSVAPLGGGAAVPPATLRGKRAALFAAIGRPESFEATVRRLGVEVVARKWWPDHYPYPAGAAAVIASLRRGDRDIVLTTEKDAVKLERQGLCIPGVFVVAAAIGFVAGDDAILQSLLTAALERGPGR
jgi:tetraacyldisaccharide 4'-kinase